MNRASPLLRINIITRADRNEAIARARDAITSSGGWVLDVKLFSNVSICFNFEIPSRFIVGLREALIAADLTLTSESEEAFSRLPAEDHVFNGDVSGTLQITFVHNEPDLRIEVLPIPG